MIEISMSQSLVRHSGRPSVDEGFQLCGGKAVSSAAIWESWR